MLLIEKNNILSIKNAFNRKKMKTLILIRHAKSSWDFDVIDHERPLSKRGKRDAELIGYKLSELQLVADLILVSDANRTKSTANIILPFLDLATSNAELKHDLYDFSGSGLTRVIKNCDNSIQNLMVFGHNHAITSFVNSYGDKFIDNVPTCGVVIIQFNTDNWKNINDGRTIEVIFPKLIRG